MKDARSDKDSAWYWSQPTTLNSAPKGCFEMLSQVNTIHPREISVVSTSLSQIRFYGYKFVA